MWRMGLVGKLRGTYSFVVFDIERVRMFAARDCSGPAPIYQVLIGCGMRVSSYKILKMLLFDVGVKV